MHAPGLAAIPTAAWAARIPRAAAGLPTRHASPTRQHEHSLHTYAQTQRIRPGAQTTRRQTQCLRRSFHASALRSAAADAGTPPTSDGDSTGSTKPGSGSPVLEQEGDIDSHILSGGRSKLTASNSLRSRQARRRNASVLPPVHLPSTFLEQNIHLHEPASQPNVPHPIRRITRKN